MKTPSILSIAVLLTALAGTEAAGQSGREYRRSAVMNGNQVRTVFGNWGVIGQPSDTRPRGAWRNDNNGYLGDVSPFIGAEVKWRDTTFRSVVSSPVARPTGLRDEDPRTGAPWTMEPVDGYFGAPPNQSIALSNDQKTWPAEWPDKLGDPSDPGWRGSWNGYFGKRISADLETYFLMDDNSDFRFNVATNNPRGIEFHPDSNNLSRNGLGLSIRVRGLQWAQFLAQDNIFWLYEIENSGTTTYDRVVFGMLVGTYVGVTGSQDAAQEYDDDWSFYDVFENITYTGDYGKSTARNPRWNQDFPVGMVGYAFLESPGNPFDQIDNDADGDSSSVGQTFPQFTSTSFDSTLIARGQRIVLIQDDFTRVSYVVPSRDSVKVYTRGLKDSIWIYPGRTKVVEGNTVIDQLGNQVVNRNSYDGVDNDFDGLIDENQFLHYRQFKRNRNPPFQVLIDVTRPVRYVNQVIPGGINPAAMIDERRDDLADNDGDWNLEFDDVGRDGIGPTAVNYPGPDFGESDGQPTSGYDLLGNDTGLPGEPNIDKTDVDESDQIGLSSFYYFTPANVVRLGDDEELWRNLAPGFFDVPASISNNRPVAGEDGDFIYGSGFFPLRAKSTERFSLALVYGGGKGGSVDEDISDLLKNKKTVQRIYDANYQFPTPPEKPTLTAVPGDRRVTLYWNRVSEQTVDPVLRVKDFEGYKLYKSTDPDFSDIFTITDGSGNPRGYRPLGQYDIKDDIKGYFRPSQELFEAAQGYSFFLGDDTGLQHSFVDSNVDNGRRYYYAVVAYDRGDEAAGIFPGENTKQVSVLSTGEVVADINVAVVVPNAPVAGYVEPKDEQPLARVAGPGTGDATYSILDQTRLTGHGYRVTFLDSQVDGIDNNANGKLDAADSTEWNRLATAYSVLDETPVGEEFTGADTALVTLQRQNIVPGSESVKDAAGATVPPTSYIVNYQRGTIQGAAAGSLPAGTYRMEYLYYPVFQSPNIQGSPFLVENTESDIFDGTTVNFRNYWYVKDTLYTDGRPSGWVGPNAYIINWGAANFPLLIPPIVGYSRPGDYQIQFADQVVDTATAGADPFIFPPTPTNFRIFNTTDQRYVDFYMFEIGAPGLLSPGDNIILLEENPRGEIAPTWQFFVTNKPGEPGDTVVALGDGDFYIRQTTKSFGVRDTLRLSTDLPGTDAAVAQTTLNDIRVVPNPYVTAASFEQPLPPGVTSGRGERKVDFTNVPAGSTIRVFTSRGDHVVTLRHDGGIENGTVSWNLRTSENLDIAFGVYFYVVESPAGTKTGKIAIIK